MMGKIMSKRDMVDAIVSIKLTDMLYADFEHEEYSQADFDHITGAIAFICNAPVQMVLESLYKAMATAEELWGGDD